MAPVTKLMRGEQNSKNPTMLNRPSPAVEGAWELPGAGGKSSRDKQMEGQEDSASGSNALDSDPLGG